MRKADWWLIAAGVVWVGLMLTAVATIPIPHRVSPETLRLIEAIDRLTESIENMNRSVGRLEDTLTDLGKLLP